MFTDTKRAPFTPRDVRFTTRGDVLYAILLAKPERVVTIQSLSTNLRLYSQQIGDVRLLGSGEILEWRCDAEGLRVILPETLLCDHACALKITPQSAAQ
jgi:alpha-L-fucosidase